MSATLARAVAIFYSRKKAQKITEYRDTAPLNGVSWVDCYLEIFVWSLLLEKPKQRPTYGVPKQMFCKWTPVNREKILGEQRSEGRLFHSKVLIESRQCARTALISFVSTPYESREVQCPAIQNSVSRLLVDITWHWWCFFSVTVLVYQCLWIYVVFKQTFLLALHWNSQALTDQRFRWLFGVFFSNVNILDAVRVLSCTLALSHGDAGDEER